MSRLIHALICDDVRIEAGSNKHILIGVFDRFNVADFAAPLPDFYIFASIVVDTEAGHSLVVSLRDPTGDSTVILDATIVNADLSAVYELPVAIVSVRVRGLVLPAGRPGIYEFVMTVDGSDLGGIRMLTVPKIEAAPE